MQDFIYRHKRILLIIAILSVVAVIGVSAYFIVMDRIYSAKVNMIVAPTIAKVKIGDKIYDGTGEYKIQPGKYNVEVSAEGFVSKAGEIETKEGETTNVSFYLEPTEKNKNWYVEHSEDALIMGAVQNQEATEKRQKLEQENPILQKLPMTIEYYTNDFGEYVKYVLSYTVGDNNEITILIKDHTGGNKDAALKKLAENGATADRYTIKYEDLEESYTSYHAPDD